MFMNNKCAICDNKRKQYKNNTFAKTCGNKKCIITLRKNTNIKKYGHVCNLHSEKGKEQVKNTLKNRYGNNIINVSQIECVKKLKETVKQFYLYHHKNL